MTDNCTECNWIKVDRHSVHDYLTGEGIVTYSWKGATPEFYASQQAKELVTFPDLTVESDYIDLAVTPSGDVVAVLLYKGDGGQGTKAYAAFVYACNRIPGCGYTGWSSGFKTPGKVLAYGGLPLLGGTVGKFTYDKSRGHGHTGLIIGAIGGLIGGVIAEKLWKNHLGVWDD